MPGVVDGERSNAFHFASPRIYHVINSVIGGTLGFRKSRIGQESSQESFQKEWFRLLGSVSRKRSLTSKNVPKCYAAFCVSSALSRRRSPVRLRRYAESEPPVAARVKVARRAERNSLGATRNTSSAHCAVGLFLSANKEWRFVCALEAQGMFRVSGKWGGFGRDRRREAANASRSEAASSWRWPSADTMRDSAAATKAACATSSPRPSRPCTGCRSRRAYHSPEHGRTRSCA